jgi:hypothetical protein
MLKIQREAPEIYRRVRLQTLLGVRTHKSSLLKYGVIKVRLPPP